MPNASTIEYPTVTSPRQLVETLDSKLPLTNDHVVVAVLNCVNIFSGEFEVDSIHYVNVLDVETTAADFYTKIANELSQDNEADAIVVMRGRDRNSADTTYIEYVFDDKGYQVLDVLQVDWNEKTWASDMCGNPSCCDQSMTQSFLPEAI